VWRNTEIHTNVLVGKTWRKKDYVVDLGIDVRIILKCSLKR